MMPCYTLFIINKKFCNLPTFHQEDIYVPVVVYPYTQRAKLHALCILLLIQLLNVIRLNEFLCAGFVKRQLDIQLLRMKTTQKWMTVNFKEASLIWVRSRNCGYLVTWFCYQLIGKPGNKTAPVSWPDPYAIFLWNPQVRNNQRHVLKDIWKAIWVWYI